MLRCPRTFTESNFAALLRSLLHSDVLRPQCPDPHPATLGRSDAVEERKGRRKTDPRSAARIILFADPDSHHGESRGTPYSSSVPSPSRVACSYANECVVGYSVFAFNQTIHKKLDPKTHRNLAQTLVAQLKRRPGVAFLKRITIVLDETSEKGFGLVSDPPPPVRAHGFTPWTGEHEFIDFLRLRHYCFNTDHPRHLIGRVLDTQSALCTNRTCNIAPPDSPPFTIPSEAHADANRYQKRCSVRDELLWCLR